MRLTRQRLQNNYIKYAQNAKGKHGENTKENQEENVIKMFWTSINRNY